MAMLGVPLQGAFEVHCSGHQHNNVFLRRLEAEGATHLDIVTLNEEAPYTPRRFPAIAVSA